MKVIALCFGVLVLAITVSGQTVSAPDNSVTAREMTSLSEDRLVAKGGVKLTIGTTVITADEAEIHYGGPGKLSDIRLSGPVCVKAILQSSK
jgi:nucleoid-associated protein YgaU